MSTGHEEEALGKAYDARLMRRLMQYLHPYRWRVILALALVAIVTPLELAPPLLFGYSIDHYFSPAIKGLIPESQAWVGVRCSMPRQAEPGLWAISGRGTAQICLEPLGQYSA